MKSLALAALLLATSCTSAATVVSRDVEDRVTVTHGLYGQAVAWGDGGEGDGPFALSTNLDVSADASSSVLLATDPVGFFQLALDAGTYQICTAWQDCHEFAVPASGVIRIDYQFGVDTGWHEVTAGSRPDAGP